MITNLDQHSFHQLVKEAQKPIIIDVFATWCGPCQHMKPFLEELATTYKDDYVFTQVNIDEAQELAIELQVTSVPTFLFYKHGKLVAREIGYMSKEDLEEKIQTHLGA